MVEPWGCVSSIVHFRLQICTQPEVDPRVFQGRYREGAGVPALLTPSPAEHHTRPSVSVPYPCRGRTVRLHCQLLSCPLPLRMLRSLEKRVGRPVGLHLLSALVILTLALEEWVQSLSLPSGGDMVLDLLASGGGGDRWSLLHLTIEGFLLAFCGGGGGGGQVVSTMRY